MTGRRSVAAATWATVLSELALVPVTVQWEAPSWRVRWVDGPTLTQLLSRAVALDSYGVGAPLTVPQLRFSRSVSSQAVAVGWLVHGSKVTEVEQQRGMTAWHGVEGWCEDTGYPQRRAGAQVTAAATMLCAVARGDTATIAALVTRANPPIEPSAPTGAVTAELPGRVASYRWPGRGGPPGHLLGPAEPSAPPDLPQQPVPPAHPDQQGKLCSWCGGPLPAKPRRRGGRPAQFCSDRCRVAAHRHRHIPRADAGSSQTSAVPSGS